MIRRLDYSDKRTKAGSLESLCQAATFPNMRAVYVSYVRMLLNM